MGGVKVTFVDENGPVGAEFGLDIERIRPVEVPDCDTSRPFRKYFDAVR